MNKKQEDYCKRQQFRRFIMDLRRLVNGNTDSHLDMRITQWGMGYGDAHFLNNKFHIPFPEDYAGEAEKILHIAHDHVSFLSDGDKRLLITDLNEDERTDAIKEYLTKHRYVKPVRTIADRLNISDEKLEGLLQRIHPVHHFADGKLWYIKPCHPRNVAFTWDPRKLREAAGLEELARIKTYHEYSSHVFFKPSLAEVLAQIPRRFIDNVNAFEIPVGWNDPDPEPAGGYHKITTILYRISKVLS